jgi:nudix-type nucleoside diphosphatase (YffH/AdpP family)
MTEDVRILEHKILGQRVGIFEEITYQRERFDGVQQHVTREIYRRDHAASILLYDPTRRKVILVRQFRLPAYLSGDDNPLIEVCAGKLEGKAPEERIIEEVREETGYEIKNPRRVFQAYMSPGAYCEKQTLFVAAYSPADCKGNGGGLAEEGEDIEVLELDFDIAYGMIASGEIIDAKTIMLLQYAKLEKLI